MLFSIVLLGMVGLEITSHSTNKAYAGLGLRWVVCSSSVGRVARKEDSAEDGHHKLDALSVDDPLALVHDAGWPFEQCFGKLLR
jgi:hypothetical protein